MQKNDDSDLLCPFLHWGGWSSIAPWFVNFRWWQFDNYLATLSFPFVFDVLRETEPLTPWPAFRSPELVSLDAPVNFDEEPDLARRAYIAGIPIEPLWAVSSLLKAVERMMSILEGSGLYLFFPFVLGLLLLSSERPRIASESELSELSESNGSESSARGLLLALCVDIGRIKSEGWWGIYSEL